MQNIPKNKKGKMTIDKLAQMTAGGFSELRNEFKGDIKKLENKIDKLDNEFIGLKGEFNGLKSEVNDKIDNGVNKMLVIADGMAKQFSDWKQENAFGAGIESRQNEQLKDHEVRIKKLEVV